MQGLFKQDRDAIVALLDQALRKETRTEPPSQAERSDWLYGSAGFTEPDEHGWTAPLPQADMWVPSAGVLAHGGADGHGRERRADFETGPLSIWFYHALSAAGLPAICIDARHAKAALDMAPNKTDANDADGLAHLAEVGFYRVVRVKGFDSMLTRTLVAARGQLRKTIVQMSNQIRGLMKTFGLIVPKGAGSVFENHVRRLLAGEAALARIMLPLLEAWRSLRSRAVDLDRQLIASARQNEASALLMSIPGVGAVTASSYVAAIEDPANFRSSRSVGAWLGLTTRRYQSGEVDYDGHISRRGDVRLRALLYEAATTILTRVVANSALRTWGLKLREKLGCKRATVAVARKLAVIMHSMLKSGQPFDRLAVSAA